MIHYSCEDGIEKSVPREHRLSSRGNLVMTNDDNWDGLLDPTLTLMIYYTVISCLFVV